MRAAGSGQRKRHQQTNAGRLPVRSSNSGQLTCPSLAINQGKKASNQTTTEAQNASLGQRGAIRSKGQLHNGLRCFFFPRIQVTEYKAQGNGRFARFKKHKWRLTKHEKGIISRKGHSGNGCFARFQWAMIFFPKRNGHEAQRNRGAKRSNEIDSEKWLRKVSCKFLLCLMAR